MKFNRLILAVLLLFTSLGLSAKTEEITLAKIKLFDDKIELKVPSTFKAIPDAELKEFYPEKDLPKVALANEDKTIRLAFNVRKNGAGEGQMAAFKEKFLKEWKAFDPKLKEIANGLIPVDGREMGYLGALHKKTPEKFYRFIFFTDYEGMLLSGSLVCPKKGYKPWIEAGYAIMNSVDIK